MKLGSKIVAGELCRKLQRCPACEGDFVDHYYAFFSTTVAGERQDTYEFLAALKRYDWKAAISLKDDDRFEDLVIATALRCPGRRMSSIVMVSPYDPYSRISVLEYEALSAEHGQELEVLIPDHDWFPLGHKIDDKRNTLVNLFSNQE